MARALRAFLIVSTISSCLPLCTQAHMQMSWPYPLRSPLDPEVPVSLKDYSMTNPLLPDGSNFPCKHYQNNDTNPQAYDIKAVYQAGSAYNMSLTGSATHMGGSCQISLSYDNGVTFKVIESIIGGCPLTPSYNFTIPSFAPSSNTVLLTWSWFNLIGNREMYSNCARVSIQNHNQPIQRYRRAAYKRQASLDDLPDMFACNVGNGCKTIERREVVFPNPGPSVIYGQDQTTPDPGPGFTINGIPFGNSTYNSTMPQSTPAPYPMFNMTSTPDPTGTGTGYFNYTTATLTTTLTTSSSFLSSLTTSFIPSSTISTTSTTSPSSTIASVVDSPSVITVTVTVTVTPTPAPTTVSPSTSTSTPSTTLRTTVTTTILPIGNVAITSSTSSTTTTTTTSSTSSTASTPILSGPCTPGAFVCNSPTTFSQCVTTSPNSGSSTGSTSYIYMGSVASGMQCVAGQIIRQNAGPCTPNGQIFCNGSTAFYMCDQGGLVSMGPVAPGTKCVNGAIVAA